MSIGSPGEEQDRFPGPDGSLQPGRHPQQQQHQHRDGQDDRDRGEGQHDAHPSEPRLLQTN